jgi:hypothetical protein
MGVISSRNSLVPKLPVPKLPVPKLPVPKLPVPKLPKLPPILELTRTALELSCQRFPASLSRIC